MASNFYIVHHTARLGVAQKYFENMESWWTEDRGKKVKRELAQCRYTSSYGYIYQQKFGFLYFRDERHCL